MSVWFYYKEICYDARSHERKIFEPNPCSVFEVETDRHMDS